MIQANFFLTLFLFGIYAVNAANIPTYELQALEDLYDSTTGYYWDYPTDSVPWNFSEPDPNPCSEEWSGLTCTMDDTDDNLMHVLKLELTRYNLRGFVPVSMGLLTHLTVIDLSQNFLNNISDVFSSMPQLVNVSFAASEVRGRIPPSIWTLRKLSSLDLDSNFFSGQLPDSISSMSCISLNLASNQLNGTIPEDIFNIDGLQYLSLGRNQLTGTLPSSLGTKSLATLEVYHNFLEGTIPIDLVSNVVYLDVSFNSFRGNITEILNNAHNVIEIYLQDNQFTGDLNLPFSSLGQLTILNLGSNNLTGTLPSDFNRLTNLISLSLDLNGLCGSIPASLFMMKLNVFSLYMNDFTGPLPETLCDSGTLKYIEISSNFFNGSIPDMTKCSQLYWFQLSDNDFTGSLPDNIPSMMYFSGMDNQFEGSIPESYCNGKMYDLDLDHNSLTGSIPECIGSNGDSLGTMDLTYNFLEGSLPESLYSLSGLSSGLQLANNLFSGTLSDMSNLDPFMRNVSIQNNCFSGSLPTSLGNLVDLIVLNVENNKFTGTFPSLAKLTILETLFINNNRFSGPLTHIIKVVPGEQPRRLINFDASNNHFTGPIPTDPFLIERFQTFAAVSNCLTGSIPEVVCNATSLLTLSLDGLRSATSCQRRFFPTGLGINSYLLDGNIAGGVPECLFDLPKLGILHLSGNGLSGSIPSMSQIHNLSDVSLSNNNLRGTIPDVMQHASWTNLDLSFNKIGGVLQASTPEYPLGSTLSLQVNRLSGNVPGALKDMSDISILDGNLFGCSATRRDLPSHDPDTSDYECGSNTFNFALYAWLGLFVACVILVTLVLFWLSFQYLMPMFALVEFPKSVVDFDRFTSNFRWVTQVFVAVVICIVLPVSCILSLYYDSYSHEYAWSVSSAYLTGVVPALVLLFLFLGLMLVLYLTFQRMKFRTIDRDISQRVTWQHKLVLIAVVSIDLILMVGVNLAYVYIHNSYNSTVVQATQLCVALFKIAWNNFAVRGILKLYRMFAAQLKVDEAVCTDEEFRAVPLLEHQQVSLSSMKAVSGLDSIGVAVGVMLFNNLAAPFIATAFVSSNCFYDVITTPPDVTVSYLYSQCDVYTVTVVGQVCTKFVYGNDVRTTSYTPPFSYSYQCSSTFITTYASIYVFMFIFMGFASPLFLLLITGLRQLFDHGSTASRSLLAFLPRILRPYVASSNRESFAPFDFAGSGRRFDCDVFVVQLTNMLVVLVTFGVVVPPLAVVALVSIMSVTYFTQWCIGRFIASLTDPYCDLKPNQITSILADLESDCTGASEMFQRSVWLLVPFVVIFYSFLLFDILGDAVGWKRAIWMPVSLCAAPCLLVLLSRYRQYTICGSMSRESRRSWGSDRKSELNEEAADMAEVLLSN